MNYTILTNCRVIGRVAMVATVSAALALAQPPGRGGGRLSARPASVTDAAAAAISFDNVKQYVGLSDTDVANLEAMRKTAATDIEALVKQMAEAQQALRAATRSGSATADTLGAAQLAIENLRKQIARKQEDAQARAVATLTPAQQAKLKTLQAAIDLAPTIREAGALGIVTRPAGVRGSGGRGTMAGRGASGRGPAF